MKIVRDGIGCREKLVCHSLRHGFIQTLIEDKFPIALVSKAVGHASTKITNVYVHHSNNSRAKLKRKNPVDIVVKKLKKIKREE